MPATQEPREIELKFELDHADVPRLQHLLTMALGNEGETLRLHSTYYDTPGRQLAKAGVTLRVRADGDRLRQTVKRDPGTGAVLFQRDEWETDLAAPAPDLAAFLATPAGAAIASDASEVAAVFSTEVDRTVWEVAEGTSLIEVALDRGRVVAGPRSEALAELELELKAGAPRDLFGLLDRLGMAESLRPGVIAKSERGYRLLRGKSKGATKAEPLHLAPDVTAGEAFQAISQACIRHFCLNAAVVEDSRKPEALHQARVGLRRLRSALSLFKPLVVDGDYAALVEDLRALSRVLGHARDLDVYRAGLAAEGEQRSPAFLAALDRCREAAYDEVVSRLRSPASRVLLLRMVRWTMAGDWLVDAGRSQRAARDEPVRHAAARLLQHRRRRIRRRGRDLAALAPADRHKVRIEAKKLRYASEFFAGLLATPKVVARHTAFVAALEDLQEHLGALNDIETGHDVESLIDADGDGPGAAMRQPADSLVRPAGIDQAAEITALLGAAIEAHQRLIETKPYWSRWPD